MNKSVISLVLASCLVGCSRSAETSSEPSPATPSAISQADEASEPREVVFLAHLEGKLEDDPEVHLGELVRIVPDVSDRFVSRNATVVILPTETPYESDDELRYLQGYAVGQLFGVNFSLI